MKLIQQNRGDDVKYELQTNGRELNLCLGGYDADKIAELVKMAHSAGLGGEPFDIEVLEAVVHIADEDDGDDE